MKIHCDLWVWQPEPVIVTISGQTSSQIQAFEYLLSSVSPETQQLEGAACRGHLLICCTIKQSFPLTHLKARRVRTKTTNLCSGLGPSGAEGGRSWEWEMRTQRTRSHVPLVYNVQLYPTGRLEPMNVKSLSFYQTDKAIFSQEVVVTQGWKQFVFAW